MEKFEFEITAEDAGVRIDKFLAEKFLSIKPEITRSKIQNFIERKLVFDEQNQVLNNVSQKTKSGQKFFITIPVPEKSRLEPKKIDFGIIFEDEDLLVIDKPAGLTTHPGAGNQDNTLVNALLFTHQNRLSSIDGSRPGIVHRLDKDTSGLMLIAKNDFTHQILSQKLKNREVKRSYLAFIYGLLSPAFGRIEKNILRSRRNRLKMAISRSGGRVAITNYQTKEIFLNGLVSLVECSLETGRTHQIRLHLESVKHSLIGDQLYSSCRKNLPQSLDFEQKSFIEKFPRQALHSYKIAFFHPRHGKEMFFEIGLPSDLVKLKKFLESKRSD